MNQTNQNVVSPEHKYLYFPQSNGGTKETNFKSLLSFFPYYISNFLNPLCLAAFQYSISF